MSSQTFAERSSKVMGRRARYMEHQRVVFLAVCTQLRLLFTNTSDLFAFVICELNLTEFAGGLCKTWTKRLSSWISRWSCNFSLLSLSRFSQSTRQTFVSLAFLCFGSKKKNLSGAMILAIAITNEVKIKLKQTSPKQSQQENSEMLLARAGVGGSAQCG